MTEAILLAEKWFADKKTTRIVVKPIELSFRLESKTFDSSETVNIKSKTPVKKKNNNQVACISNKEVSGETEADFEVYFEIDRSARTALKCSGGAGTIVVLLMEMTSVIQVNIQ